MLAHVNRMASNDLAQTRAAHLQVEEGVVRLQLPALRRLRINGVDTTSRRLRLDRDSFRGTAKLKHVWFDAHQSIDMLPDCLVGLPALATVMLSSCGLASIPAALTALRGSLTSLELPYNDALQLTSVGVKTVLALQELQYLDLNKSSFADDDVVSHRASDAVVTELGYQPALWSVRSVQHLSALSKAFLAQHGRELDLILDDEGCTDEEIEDEGDVDSEAGD